MAAGFRGRCSDAARPQDRSIHPPALGIPARLPRHRLHLRPQGSPEDPSPRRCAGHLPGRRLLGAGAAARAPRRGITDRGNRRAAPAGRVDRAAQGLSRDPQPETRQGEIQDRQALWPFQDQRQPLRAAPAVKRDRRPDHAEDRRIAARGAGRHLLQRPQDQGRSPGRGGIPVGRPARG